LTGIHIGSDTVARDGWRQLTIEKSIKPIKVKLLKKIKWIARITATIMFLFAFPFYIGYGLPFPNLSLSLIKKEQSAG